MTPEQKAAFVMAQSACAFAKVAGMAAVNQACAASDEPPAYGIAEFDAVFGEFIISQDAVLKLFGLPAPVRV